MPATIRVRSDADSVIALVNRILGESGNGLPKERLLCFFDTEDCWYLKDLIGKANRGLYTRIDVDAADLWTDEYWGAWPSYVKDCIVVDDQRLFDHLIYLHGSTCSNEIGLTMTFAHELQHFVQWGHTRTTWALNCLVSRLFRELPKEVVMAERFAWADIPVEYEARSVSKRMAQSFFGVERVHDFISTMITSAVDSTDRADWEFVQRLDSTVPFDLVGQTRTIYQRLSPYRSQLESILNQARGDADFRDVVLSLVGE